MISLWTDGHALLPCDFRIYDKPLSGSTKNDHFRQMLAAAQQWGFQPQHVLLDSWFTSPQNLKAVRTQGWSWLTQFRSPPQAELVNPDGGLRAGGNAGDPAPGTDRAFAGLRVGQGVSDRLNGRGRGTLGHRPPAQTVEGRQGVARQAWGIEVYHRGIEQCFGVEKSPGRKAQAQRNHIWWSLQAQLRLEAHRLRMGISWYEAKISIFRDALRNYLAQIWYQLPPTA